MLAGLTSQLAHSLGYLSTAARGGCLTVGELATVRVDRAIATEGQVVRCDPVGRLTLLAEAGFLQLAHDGDRERVVDLQNVHVVRAVAGQAEGLPGSLADRTDRDLARM